MNGNHTMVHHVRPRPLYSHDGTYTSNDLCRRPSSLVAFHLCYLLDRASIHEISALMIFILDSSVYHISSSTMEILIHCILYVAMTTHDTLYIIPIHGHCTFMYLGLLYVFAVTCKDLSFYHIDEWLVPPLGSSLLHFWDVFYNVFRPSCYPTDLTH